MAGLVIYPHVQRRLGERGIPIAAVRHAVAAGTRAPVEGGRVRFEIDARVVARYPRMASFLGLSVVCNEVRAVVTVFWADAMRRAS